MFEKLDSLLKRYDELHKLIADHDIISDMDKYQKLARELSSLGDIVKRYNEYKKIVSEISGAKHLLEKDSLLVEGIKIKTENIEIPCLSLESEKTAYEKMGREKDLFKIQKINLFINTKIS